MFMEGTEYKIIKFKSGAKYLGQRLYCFVVWQIDDEHFKQCFYDVNFKQNRVTFLYTLYVWL